MNILIFGKTGQVARALAKAMPSSLEGKVYFLGHDEADLLSESDIAASIQRLSPSVVINTAAYTAVDMAESHAHEARCVNALAPQVMARVCAELGIRLIHYSTDYVFPGTGRLPWNESDSVEPLSVYGKTKEEGERLIRQANPSHIILRTSWVYDAEGRNFLTTMLRLGAERESLKVVCDQVGAPTAAIEIARATWKIVELSESSAFHAWGTYHLCADGETSWYGFARAIFENARRLGIPLKVRDISAIPSSEYPMPAKRPLNSRLSHEKLERVFGIRLPSWEDSLEECLVLLAAKGRDERH